MEVSGKTIKFSNTLWVQHGGVRVKNEKETVLVEGVDDESYLKIFNHFGRVLRLYTFEVIEERERNRARRRRGR